MNIKKFFHFKLILLLLVIAAAAGGAWYFWGDKKAEIEYRAVAARRTELQSVIQATGTLSAVETVDVGTQISGTIKEIYIDYNSVVKKGQLRAEIDSATQAADVAQAEANLSSAMADMMKVKRFCLMQGKNLAEQKNSHKEIS